MCSGISSGWPESRAQIVVSRTADVASRDIGLPDSANTPGVGKRDESAPQSAYFF
jgi:hypothetical protein